MRLGASEVEERGNVGNEWQQAFAQAAHRPTSTYATALSVSDGAGAGTGWEGSGE